jgi:hypothetical protein
MLRRLKYFSALTLGAFVLYALTAQRGLGWGDSGQFQHWVLGCEAALCGASFSNSHPLYVWLARMVSVSPFHVTLVSSFFGALAVGGFYLCSRNLPLSALFASSHMLWWLSCVSEVQTMSLAFTVFGTLAFLRYLESGRSSWLFAAAFISGLHLEVHNFALLPMPVYIVGFLVQAKKMPVARAVAVAVAAAALWAAGAAYWIAAVFDRGLADVLVGAYAAQVAGVIPSSPKLTLFNMMLASMSFLVPVALVWWNRPGAFKGGLATAKGRAIWAIFAVNFIFFIRYFVPDQATFALPSLFFAFLLVSHLKIGVSRFASLALMQIVLPVTAFYAASRLPIAENLKARHMYRDEAAYFALPWKFNDDSADRCAAVTPGAWDGYPAGRKESGK